MGIFAVLLLIGGALSGLSGLSAPEVEEGVEDEPAVPDTDEAALLLGTDDEDLLAGGDGGDWLLGLNGDDIMTGGAGGDVLIGGAGLDRIEAGAGQDFVESANVVDETALRLSAERADDVSDVDFTYDLPRASDAGDMVDLGPGDDTVVAGSDDAITGGPGSDIFALGDWIEGGQPAEITDFDEAEDVISFVYDRSGDVPEMDILRDPQTGVTTIRADGQSVAILRGASPEFSLRNVVVGRYAA